MFSREIRLNFAGKRANWVLRNLGISPLSHFPPSNRYFLYTSIYAYKAGFGSFPKRLRGKMRRRSGDIYGKHFPISIWQGWIWRR